MQVKNDMLCVFRIKWMRLVDMELVAQFLSSERCLCLCVELPDSRSRQ